MRLLRLQLEEFGPYQGREVVDFRVLESSRLFLVHGPVGSGKTFLLDGICFALYGRSSAGERDRSGLRNLNAPPEHDTVATLDFRCGEESFRVERRFPHPDPETDSDQLEDDVTLWRLPRVGEPTRRDILSAKVGGVSQMITKLLGLTADQFCQVAILPQGHFRKFLLAEGDQRRAILKNMFGSERYAEFQDRLQAHYVNLKQELEESWSEREELVAQYRDHGGDPRESLHRSTEELQAVLKDCHHHQDRSGEWERSLEEAVRFEMLDRQRDMSERELAALSVDGSSPEEALMQRLRESLAPYEEWRRLVQESEVISGELQQQRNQYEKLKSETNFLEAEVERARQLEEERFSLRRNIERLETLKDDVRGAELLSAEFARTKERLAELSERRVQLAGELKRSKARVAELTSEMKKRIAGAQKLKSLKDELERISEAQGEARKNNLIREAYDQAEQREARFVKLIQELKEERSRLKEELAAERELELHDALHLLKSTLNAGEECPLCGSLDHPNPFNKRRESRALCAEHEEALELLSQRLKLAESELAQAKERKARLNGRMEERELTFSECLEVDKDTVRNLRQTIALVEEKVNQKEDIANELQELKAAFKPERVRLKKMRLLKERLQATLAGIQSQMQARQKVLFRVAGDFFEQLDVTDLDGLSELIEAEISSLKDRLEELSEVTFTTERAELMAETFAMQLAETRASEKRREQLQASADEIRETLIERFRLEFSGWDALSFALGRLSRESKLRSGSDSVVDKEMLIRTVEHQLHQSRELLATLPVPELKSDQIRQALAREREHLEQKISRRVNLERALEKSTEDVGRYDDLVVKIRGLEEKFAILEKLASLAQGSGGVTFHDWYLEQVFAKVISAANLRLEILAPNRFCLALQQGLEVKIVDFQAAKERPATTLSGGESFLASLALALGLGDILQSDRNSRERLQTLFIDEGFGYLDRRALEASLECLESLKQEGRIVGVVSHVSALRERIRAQVVVAANDSPLPYGVDRIQVFAD